MSNAELPIEVIDKLRQIQLPNGWELTDIRIEFKKYNRNVPIESNYVIFDNRNKVFYAQTARGYIYPEEIKNTQECIKIMEQANKLIKNLK